MKIKQSKYNINGLFILIMSSFMLSALQAADMSSANFTAIRATVLSGGAASSSTNFNQSSSISSPTANIVSLSTLFNVLQTFPALPDQDGDMITENIDNCLQAVNTHQLDTDQDGFGNRCDGDLNNDGQVNILDLGLFRLSFNTNDRNSDFNGDGMVNLLDLGLFRSFSFGQPPGPSALAP